MDLRSQKRKAFAVLVDPDKVSVEQMVRMANLCNEATVDYLFVGGSLMITSHLDECIKSFKQHSDIPVILFPGSPSQLSRYAMVYFTSR